MFGIIYSILSRSTRIKLKPIVETDNQGACTGGLVSGVDVTKLCKMNQQIKPSNLVMIRIVHN